MAVDELARPQALGDQRVDEPGGEVAAFGQAEPGRRDRAQAADQAGAAGPGDMMEKQRLAGRLIGGAVRVPPLHQSLALQTQEVADLVQHHPAMPQGVFRPARHPGHA
jgi:hypothetical protein